jgi:hypothetical protein
LVKWNGVVVLDAGGRTWEEEGVRASFWFLHARRMVDSNLRVSKFVVVAWVLTREKRVFGVFRLLSLNMSERIEGGSFSDFTCSCMWS